MTALHLQFGISRPPRSAGRLITAQFLLHEGSDVLVASARALEIQGLTHTHFCAEHFASAIYLQADAVSGNIENVALLMRLHLEALRHSARFLETTGALLIDYLKVEPAYRGHGIGARLIEALSAQAAPDSFITLEPCPMSSPEDPEDPGARSEGRQRLARYWQSLPSLHLTSFGHAEDRTLLCAGMAASVA